MALLNGAGVAHLVNNSVGDGVADGGGPGSANSPGVAHPPGLGVAVGGRGVSSSSSNRGSGVSGSVERISISLTLGNTGVDQTGSIANSLHSSGNTGNANSRGDSNTRSVSNNVGRVGNVDGGLGADLLGDVLAVLDGGGVNDGGDLVMALLLLVALLHLGALLLRHLSTVLLGNLLTVLFLDDIDHVVALRLLSRSAHLLGHGPGDSMALLNRPAAALLLSVSLGVGDGPGVADRLTDGVALLAGDGVVGGLAVV